jgi:hypothetical protein
VNPAFASGLNGSRSPRDVLGMATRKAADNRTLNFFRYRTHRLEVTRRGGRKAGFDDIDIHIAQSGCDPKFFMQGHAAAWGLLTIPKSGVKNNHSLILAICIGLFHHVISVYSLRTCFLQMPACKTLMFGIKKPRYLVGCGVF